MNRSGDNQIEFSSLPTAKATIEAILLGLFIPLFSSIIPIRSAMSKSLSDGINASRSKTKGLNVNIDDKDSF
jgi:hypothetical protein